MDAKTEDRVRFVLSLALVLLVVFFTVMGMVATVNGCTRERQPVVQPTAAPSVMTVRLAKESESCLQNEICKISCQWAIRDAFDDLQKKCVKKEEYEFYPDADDEPPQRPWQELRDKKP